MMLSTESATQLSSAIPPTPAVKGLSVIITIRDQQRASPIDQIYRDYKEVFDKAGYSSSFIFVLEESHSHVLDKLQQLNDQGEDIKIVVFGKYYGEATSLNAGFKYAEHEHVLMLPAYHQIEPAAIPSIIEGIEDYDMITVRRWPRQGGWSSRIQTRLYNTLIRKLVGTPFKDLTSSIRLIKRDVINHIHMYGDQQRFFPILAQHVGFKVKEIDAPQASTDLFSSLYSFGMYARRLLDLLSIFFLIKFTAKPLRFFGMNGFVVFALGFSISATLCVQRLVWGVALANRPLLLIGVLLIVLGILLFAIGLIGELIIFVHAKDFKQYRVEKIIN